MNPVRFPLSGAQWKGKDPAFCNLTSWKTPAQRQNLEISMTWAQEPRLRQGWFNVSPGNTILSYLEAFLYPWGIFFMFQYVFMCVFVCVHAILHQREIPSLVPEAWGPMFVVIWKELHLSGITLWTIQSFLSSAWIMNGKQETSQTPRLAEMTTTTPYF